MRVLSQDLLVAQATQSKLWRLFEVLQELLRATLVVNFLQEILSLKIFLKSFFAKWILWKRDLCVFLFTSDTFFHVWRLANYEWLAVVSGDFPANPSAGSWDSAAISCAIAGVHRAMAAREITRNWSSHDARRSRSRPPAKSERSNIWTAWTFEPIC